MGRAPRVVVVGGSQAGLMTAIALGEIGCDVHVFERSAKPLKDRGAGINLHVALVDLLSHRASLDLAPLSCSVTTQQYLGPQNEVVYREPLAMTFSSWNALFQLLHGSLGEATYHLDATFVDHAPAGSTVVARFTDGRIETADLIVFADGISSTGRSILTPQAGPRYAGYVVWRGCVREAEMSPEYRELFDKTHTTCLLDQSHMNLYLVPGPKDTPRAANRLFNFVWYRNVAEGDALENLTTDKNGTIRSISIPPGFVQDRFVNELRHAAVELLPPAAAELVVKTSNPFVQVIYDVEVDRMAWGRACLVGDAAFLARPHLGAGTAKAAENAWALASAIERTDGDMLAALEIWEPAELDLGKATVHRSRDLGNRLQFNCIHPSEHSAQIRAPLRDQAARLAPEIGTVGPGVRAGAANRAPTRHG